MPTITCQLNLTLDVPLAERVERLAYEANLRPSGYGRALVQQRLDLEKAGWVPTDKELGVILEGVVSLDEKGREKLVKFLKDKSLLPEKVVVLVEKSMFPESAFPFRKV